MLSKNIAHAWSIVDQSLRGENWTLEGGHMPIVNLARKLKVPRYHKYAVLEFEEYEIMLK